LDKETSHITRNLSNRVCSYYSLATDLSGYSIKDEEKGWLDDIPPSLLDILKYVGKYYVPFLLANQAALKREEKQFAFEIEPGVRWEQPTFKYQSKCLDWLRESFQAVKDKKTLLAQLKGTGIEQMFAVSQL